jgi:hypothetical protein
MRTLKFLVVFNLFIFLYKIDPSRNNPTNLTVPSYFSQSGKPPPLVPLQSRLTMVGGENPSCDHDNFFQIPYSPLAMAKFSSYLGSSRDLHKQLETIHSPPIPTPDPSIC